MLGMGFWVETVSDVTGVAFDSATVKTSLGESQMSKDSKGTRRRDEEAVHRISPSLNSRHPRAEGFVGPKKRSILPPPSFQRDEVDRPCNGR